MSFIVQTVAINGNNGSFDEYLTESDARLFATSLRREYSNTSEYDVLIVFPDGSSEYL